MADIWDEQQSDASDTPKQPSPLSNASPTRALNGRGMPIGSGLGKYRILDRVRTTHHAIVYNARDAMLDRVVIIKQLNPGLLDDPLACGDFKHEAQLLARVPKDARNVIGIHELIGDNQGLFIVEEYVSGEWLESLISKRKVGLADALRLLKYGCLGLRSLHSRKIVHRDIQPANLLLSPNGQIRIANFACAVHEGDHTPPPVIASKYAAPELQAGKPHDDRVDIYALGMTIYEICVGRRNLHAHFAAITRDAAAAAERWKQWHIDPSLPLPYANALNPAVPPALAAILHQMTIKDIDERFASSEEVLQEIIRRFGAQRANVAQSIPGVASARLVDARPNAALTTEAASASQAARPIPSLLHLAKPNQLTLTHRVEPDEKTTPATTPSRAVPPVPLKGAIETPATAPRPATLPASAGPARPSSPTRARRVAPRVERSPVTSKPVPVPAPMADPPKKRRPILIPLAAALILAASIYIGANFWWEQHSGRPAQQSARAMIDEGMSHYTAGDYEKARALFLEVIAATVADQNLTSERTQAETMSLVADGQLELARGRLERVEALINEASIRGADIAALSSLRTRYDARKKAVQIAAEGGREVDAGRFIDAEARLPDYEASARAAGLDPEKLKEKLQREKDDREYDAALKRGREALADNDFDAATLACRDAQTIRVTAATRQLRQDIADAKARHEWMVRGDKAMQERDYSAAESAYQSANAIDPSDDIEQRLRIASSMRLYQEANALIQSGDLVEAKKKLENSLWKYPNKRARAKLNALAKAFDAAQLVVNADREMENGRVAEAIRLYEKAIPDLVTPALEIAKAKLEAAQKATTRPAGG